MQGPIPLKLTQIALRRLLVMNLKFLIRGAAIEASAGCRDPHLHESELLSGQTQSEFMATALVLEGIDAAEGLSDGDIESEMGKGEESNGDPAMAALEARGKGLG